MSLDISSSKVLLLVFVAVSMQPRLMAEAFTIWPRPSNQTSNGRTLYIERRRFHFAPQSQTGTILADTLCRYTHILLEAPPTMLPPSAIQKRLRQLGPGQAIQQVRLHVASSSEDLSLYTSEKYSLAIAAPTIDIHAETVYGAMRALESLAQMVDTVCLDGLPSAEGVQAVEDGISNEADSKEKKVWQPGCLSSDYPKHHYHQPCRGGRRVLLLDQSEIKDEPRFRYRGLLIDTARHFLPLNVIKVDDQSFPLQSQVLPLLSSKGAFREDLVYSAGDVREVVRYAQLRGIRVIPELDTPGHTLSWSGYPGLLTPCYNSRGEATGALGPMNPARNDTYALLRQLVGEVAALFPDKVLHAGGDEVDFSCWESNPEVRQWVEEQGWDDYAKAQDFHMRQVVRLAAEAGKSTAIWEEAWQADLEDKNTVVQVWKWWADGTLVGPEQSFARGLLGSSRLRLSWLKHAIDTRPEEEEGAGTRDGGQPAWASALERITRAGFPAVLSAPWYINLGSFADQDWAQYYAVEPLAFDATPEQAELVLGGEASMWGEYVDATNSITRTWPRTAAVAERLWSPKGGDLEDAHDRIKEHRCRMLARGAPAEPLGPGFCPVDTASG